MHPHAAPVLPRHGLFSPGMARAAVSRRGRVPGRGRRDGRQRLRQRHRDPHNRRALQGLLAHAQRHRLGVVPDPWRFVRCGWGPSARRLVIFEEYTANRTGPEETGRVGRGASGRSRMVLADSSPADLAGAGGAFGRQYGKTNNVRLDTLVPGRRRYAYVDVPEHRHYESHDQGPPLGLQGRRPNREVEVRLDRIHHPLYHGACQMPPPLVAAKGVTDTVFRRCRIRCRRIPSGLPGTLRSAIRG